METNITINPRYASSADAVRFIQDIPERFKESGTVVYDKRNQIRLVDSPCQELPDMAIKRFRRLSPLKAAVYTYFSTTKAKRAYDNAFVLLGHGIDTPEPIAYIEIKERGLIRDCYYVCGRMVAPAIKDGLYYLDSYNSRLADDFAAMVAKMHRAGVLHNDLNCDNVLYVRDYTTGGYRFSLIDINRMTVLKEGELPDVHQCAVNLSRFCRDVDIYRRVVSAYVRYRGWDAGMVDKFVDYKVRFNRNRRIKKYILHPFRHN